MENTKSYNAKSAKRSLFDSENVMLKMGNALIFKNTVFANTTFFRGEVKDSSRTGQRAKVDSSEVLLSEGGVILLITRQGQEKMSKTLLKLPLAFAVSEYQDKRFDLDKILLMLSFNR